MRKSVKYLMFTVFSLMSHPQAFAEQVVFDFLTKERAGFWEPLTDAVRGGRSTAFMEEQGLRSAIIFGDLSLNRRGFGFASYRVKPIGKESWSFEDASALVIEARGDGRTYKLLLKDEAAFRSEEDYSWQAQFTPKDQFESFVLPLNSFRPIFRGNEMEETPTFDPRSIFQIGIQINDGKSGPFSVEVKSLKAL
jgi:hypothetical protein